MITGSAVQSSLLLISYGVKGGHVRVIHCKNAARQLLKGHREALVDSAFSPHILRPGYDLLATVSLDGTAILWEISLADVPSDVEIEAREIARLRSASSSAIHRVLFHPVIPGLLLVAHGNKVSGIDVATARMRQSSLPPNSSGGVTVVDVETIESVVLNAHTSAVSDLCFSMVDAGGGPGKRAHSGGHGGGGREGVRLGRDATFQRGYFPASGFLRPQREDHLLRLFRELSIRARGAHP